MKKLMTVAALVASALVFTGCGGKPKIPANTVAAVYVDLENLVGNAFDVVDDAIDEIPNKEKRKEMREEFKKFVKDHKPDIKAVDPEWLTITLGINKELAAVVKCNYEKAIPSFTMNVVGEGTKNQSLKDIVTGGNKPENSGSNFETYKVNGIPIVGSGFVTFAKGKYVIVTEKKDVMEQMIDLYVNGKGETSDDFDDLTDIGGDTIIRVQTAEVETIAKLAGVKEDIEKFFKEAGDEDMADLILDIENITLDINFSDDIVGAVLTVDAGSRELAKVVESAFNVIAFASRLGVDVGAGAGPMVVPLLKKLNMPIKDSEKFAKMIKAVADEARDAVEADRSGSTATLTLELDTDDLLEAVVPAFFE